MYRKNMIARMVSAVSRLQLAYLSRKLTPYHLGGGSYVYLLMVAENPGITQTELAEKVIIDRATVSKMLDNLEREGLIRRRPHPTDGRVSVLDPTGKGERVYREAVRVMTAYRALMFEGVSEEAQAVTLETLRRVAANIRQANDAEKLRK